MCNTKLSFFLLQIFRSLQEYHGYFIGPGDVYGGDYTIYRGGDPSNSHSTATVRVVRQRKVRKMRLCSSNEVNCLVTNILLIINEDLPDPQGKVT